MIDNDNNNRFDYGLGGTGAHRVQAALTVPSVLLRQLHKIGDRRVLSHMITIMIIILITIIMCISIS